MLTVCDRLRVTVGYLGLRLNYHTHEACMDWVEKMRGYYHIHNSTASEEVVQEYVKRNFHAN